MVIGGVVDFAGPSEVVTDEQVEVAVVIHIEPGGGGAPVLGVAADAGIGGDIEEAAVAEVFEEVVGAGGGDEDVGESVVIVVPGGDAHAVAGEVEAGVGSGVGEVALAVVEVEVVGGCGCGRVGLPGPEVSIDEEEVLQAIVVVIEGGNAAAHGFGQEFIAVGAVGVGEGDAGWGGDLGEGGSGDSVEGLG
ncbi:MAG: hypothetical protein RI897_1425 [Verrucomicrobiota bacterium]